MYRGFRFRRSRQLTFCRHRTAATKATMAAAADGDAAFSENSLFASRLVSLRLSFGRESSRAILVLQCTHYSRQLQLKTTVTLVMRIHFVFVRSYWTMLS